MWGKNLFRSRGYSKVIAIGNIEKYYSNADKGRRFDRKAYDAHDVDGATVFTAPLSDDQIFEIDTHSAPEIVSIPSDAPKRISSRFSDTRYDSASDFINSRPRPEPFDYAVFRKSPHEYMAGIRAEPASEPESVSEPATEIPVETVVEEIPVVEVPVESEEVVAEPDIPVETVMDDAVPAEPEVVETVVEEIPVEEIPAEPEVVVIEPTEPEVPVLDNVLDDFDDAPAPVYVAQEVPLPVEEIPVPEAVADVAEASLSASELGIRVAAISAARLESVLALSVPEVPEVPADEIASAACIAASLAVTCAAASAYAVGEAVSAVEAEKAAVAATVSSIESAVRSANAVCDAVSAVEAEKTAIAATSAAVGEAAVIASVVRDAVNDRISASNLRIVESAVRSAMAVSAAAEESARAETVRTIAEAEAAAVTLSVVSATRSAEAVLSETSDIGEDAPEVSILDEPEEEIDLLHNDYSGMGFAGNAGMAMTSEAVETVNLSIGSMEDPLPPMFVSGIDDDAFVPSDYDIDISDDVLDTDPSAPVESVAPKSAPKTVPELAKDMFGSDMIKDDVEEEKSEKDVDPRDVSAILGGSYVMPAPPVRHAREADIPAEASVEVSPEVPEVVETVSAEAPVEAVSIEPVSRAIDPRDVSAILGGTFTAPRPPVHRAEPPAPAEEVADGVVEQHAVHDPVRRKAIDPRDVSAILFG